MGAESFAVRSKGKTSTEAFVEAVHKAQWAHGHGGYSGTIAEKGEHVMIPLPEGKDAGSYAQELLDEGDVRIDDKWGPAGCIDLGDGEYLFFGWASS